MPTFTGVSHIELTVRDPERSATWYEQVLCLPRIETKEENATPGVAARLAHVIQWSTGLTFGFIRHDGMGDDEFSEFRVGLDHLALNVESRDELEQWVAHLDSCGVAHSGIKDMPYGALVVFRDPDNIQLELFALATGFRAELA